MSTPSGSATKKGETFRPRCGGAHDAQQCRFRNEVCKFGRKRGHIEKACCAKKRAEGASVGKGLPTRDHSVKELEGNDN